MPALERSIRRWDIVGLVINGVVGGGIFGLPSKVFALSGAYSIFAFGVCAACVALIVLCFAEIASRFSGTGGPYLYARATFGPTVGFTVGWLVWVARVTGFAANCSLLCSYLDLFFPGAASGFPRAAIVIAVVGILTALNIRGVRFVADAGNALAIAKLLPLAVFIAVGLFFLSSARFSFAIAPAYAPFSESVLLLVYAFTGFEMAVIPAGEIRDPRRNLPAALAIGMAIVIVLYVLIQAVCIGVLPGLAASERPLADAAARFLGPWGAAMVAAGAVVSLAGNLNILVLASSRMIFAMAAGGQLPSTLAFVHPRFRTPVISILLTASIMLALTLSGTFVYLVTFSTLARLLTYFAVCGALPVLRRTAAAAALFLLPFGTAIAACAMIAIVWLLSNGSWRAARDTAIAAAIGLCVYWFNRRFGCILATTGRG